MFAAYCLAGAASVDHQERFGTATGWRTLSLVRHPFAVRQAEIDVCSDVPPRMSILRGLARSLTGMMTLRTPLS